MIKISILFQVNVVHFKEEYGNATAAKTHHDGLAVLAFFYTVYENSFSN